VQFLRNMQRLLAEGASGAVIACLIDLTRLGVYASVLASTSQDLNYALLMVAVLAAFLGALLGNHYLGKVTMRAIQRVVAVLLLMVAVGLVPGVL
jgi:uncharacterized membrane protein YfcA